MKEDCVRFKSEVSTKKCLSVERFKCPHTNRISPDRTIVKKRKKLNFNRSVKKKKKESSKKKEA